MSGAEVIEVTEEELIRASVALLIRHPYFAAFDVSCDAYDDIGARYGWDAANDWREYESLLWLRGPACTNCDDRWCMDCVLRVIHDDCYNSCPFCCGLPA